MISTKEIKEKFTVLEMINFKNNNKDILITKGYYDKEKFLERYEHAKNRFRSNGRNRTQDRIICNLGIL